MDKTPDLEKASQIEELILNAVDFEEKLQVYSNYYSLVKYHGRITTKGSKDQKIFCMCSSCSKETGYDEKLMTYNRYLKPELNEVISKLSAFNDYRDKLIFFDSYFDIYGTYLFEDFDIKLSVQPTNSQENKVFNEFQYNRFIERYFTTSSISMSGYYQRDLKSLIRIFNNKKLNATYPELSAGKEIVLLNKHFQDHWDKEVTDLYSQLNDGVILDYTSSTWEFQKCLKIVEANEGGKFLRFLDNVNRNGAKVSYSEAFHEAIQQSDEAYESYSVITWNLINGCVREIKDKLYELSNDDSRIAYLKTTLLSFKIAGFEDYFKEIEEHLGDDIKVNQGLGAIGNVVSITSFEKYNPLHEGVASIIQGRNGIVIDISEHIADVYPTIDFSEVMKAADYRTKSTFWINAGKTADNLNVKLTNREKAQLYLYQVDLKLIQRLNTTEFNGQYSKNVEMHRNDIMGGRKPIKQVELERILAYLKNESKHPELLQRVSEDLLKLRR